jgi:tetratricopeptide (TPR) repeat protein
MDKMTGTDRQLTLGALVNRSFVYTCLEDYSNALQDLLSSSRLLPTDKSIHLSLGVCYHRLGCLQDAVRCFSNALRLDRFFTDALIGRGNSFLEFGHSTGYLYAKRDYLRALHIDPMCLMARVNLAHYFQVTGRFMQAWHQFTAAIAINPRLTSALANRAVVNLQMGNTFGAYQDISAAINIEQSSELFTNRGVINQFMNDDVNAMHDYQRALELDPNYALAHYNIANIYFYNRQFKQALHHYDLAIVNNPRDESALLNRAITKVMLKEAQSGLKDFTAALSISPHSAHIYFNRANLFASLNMLAEAEQDYTTAILLQPGDALALMRRADVRSKLGCQQQALDDYKQAVDLQTRPLHYY